MGDLKAILRKLDVEHSRMISHLNSISRTLRTLDRMLERASRKQSKLKKTGKSVLRTSR